MTYQRQVEQIHCGLQTPKQQSHEVFIVQTNSNVFIFKCLQCSCSYPASFISEQITSGEICPCAVTLRMQEPLPTFCTCFGYHFCKEPELNPNLLVREASIWSPETQGTASFVIISLINILIAIQPMNLAMRGNRVKKLTMAYQAGEWKALTLDIIQVKITLN